MRQLTSIQGNSQKLDGGSMFGHVPKALWSQWIQPDDQNRIQLACRALLVQEGNKNILLETGIGAFFSPELKHRYGVEESRHVLLDSLHAQGISDSDIDVVILSHLHFDHAGGLLSAWEENTPSQLLFPKATYMVSQDAWARACNPHARDKASFIPHLNQLLQASNRLHIVDQETSPLLGNDYRFLFTNGHTPGLMHTLIHMPEKGDSVLFASDLIPGSFWVHLPVGMGYDRFPELLVDEKKAMLELAVKDNLRLFYTHDPLIAASHIAQDASDKFKPIQTVKTIP